MGQFFNISEIIGFAIQIEEAGYRFYIETMKKVQEPNILKLFQHLADEEFKHEHIFRELLKKAGKFTPPESYRGEYEKYMNDFLQSTMFRDFKIDRGKINAIQGIQDALQIALDFEKNSIVFYTAMKQYMGDEHRPLVDTIIQEELKHIMKINQYQNDRHIGYRFGMIARKNRSALTACRRVS